MGFKRYGAIFADPEAGCDPSASIELQMAFNPLLAQASGFLGRFQHLKNAIDLIWNEPRRKYFAERRMAFDERKHDVFIWNEWSLEMMEAFCEHHWSTTIWSGNASWKTTCCAMYAICAFFASPADTVVVLTTTTLPGLRKRIWKEVLKFHRLSRAGIGQVHASDYAIRFQKGSDESGLFGIATGQNDGDIQKAVDKIIGFHSKHVIAVVDEMQATNEAIVKGCLSLEAGAESFQLLGPGNPDSELDTLGQMSEPVGGYESITPEDDRWETKKGICLHFDGEECPRVKEGDEFYPGMLTRRDLESAKKQYGEDSPEYWRTRKGFIAPQGISKIVLTPSIINKFRAKEKAIWVSGYEMGAGLDPAFEGGDRCMLRFGKCGQMLENQVGIELNELVQIKVSATSSTPLHYQIVEQVRLCCEQHDPPVRPENFALDSTGEGGGLASIFQREWSPAITLVEFGGGASTLPVSEFNPKPSNQEYLNRVTELWYTFRTMVQNGLIRGLDNETAFEFCRRIYENRGNLKMLETKAKMKLRTRRSPDLADATVVLVELFRQTQNLGSTGEKVTQTDDAWAKFRREQTELLDEEHAYLQEA
jgi:hypothetical protein